MEKYIDRFEFLLGPSNLNLINCTMCSFRNDLLITLTKAIHETDIEKFNIAPPGCPDFAFSTIATDKILILSAALFITLRSKRISFQLVLAQGNHKIILFRFGWVGNHSQIACLFKKKLRLTNAGQNKAKSLILFTEDWRQVQRDVIVLL
jgi:hypothetical protein